MIADTTAPSRSRPTGFQLVRAALLKRLPDELTSAELLQLWSRDSNGRASRSALLLAAKITLLREALASGALQAECIEGKSETRQYLDRAPAFSITNWGAPRPPRVVSRTATTPPVHWITRGDALAWFKTLDARWAPDRDCLLHTWWPELVKQQQQRDRASDARAADGRKAAGVPKERKLDAKRLAADALAAIAVAGISEMPNCTQLARTWLDKKNLQEASAAITAGVKPDFLAKRIKAAFESKNKNF